jgi:hypothetical protein
MNKLGFEIVRRMMKRNNNRIISHENRLLNLNRTIPKVNAIVRNMID